MKTIYLHGALKQFGKSFTLDVSSAGEACRALACQIRGFREFMIKSESLGLKFSVFLGGLYERGKNLSEQQLNDLTTSDSIHIVPQIMGAGQACGKWWQRALSAHRGQLGVFGTDGGRVWLDGRWGAVGCP